MHMNLLGVVTPSLFMLHWREAHLAVLLKNVQKPKTSCFNVILFVYDYSTTKKPRRVRRRGFEKSD